MSNETKINFRIVAHQVKKINCEAIIFMSLLFLTSIIMSFSAIIGIKTKLLSSDSLTILWGNILSPETLKLNVMILGIAYLIAIITKIWRMSLISNFYSFKMLVPAVLGFVYFVFILNFIFSIIKNEKVWIVLMQCSFYSFFYNAILFVTILPFQLNEPIKERGILAKVGFTIGLFVASFILCIFLL